MKVADLAAELEVPASTVLDQCQRFGIDASWAGADLSNTDVIVLRSELAGSDPIDLTDPASAAPPEPPPSSVPPAADSPAVPLAEDPAPAADPVDAPAVAAPDAAADPAPASDPRPAAEDAPDPGVDAAPAALPPTAVGSMPDLIDEVTPEVAAEAAAEEPSSRTPGFSMAGAGDDGVTSEATRRVASPPPPAKRHLDRSARNSLIAVVIAAAAFAASNYVELPALVALLWLLTAIALVVAVIDGVRGRRHVQTHPERVHGLWLSVLTVIIAVAGCIGLGMAVVTVVGDEPAADAPIGLGDLSSVQKARWGYHRAMFIKDSGWSGTAKEPGTCWVAGKYDGEEGRVEVEGITDRVPCGRAHTLEVAKVFSADNDADSPYPGEAGFVVLAQDRCGAIVAKAAQEDGSVALRVEYADEDHWNEADHDVACVLITASRDSALTN